MADSGGVRFDFKDSHGFTPGEYRTVRYPTVDADGANIADFTGWQFEWFLLDSLKYNGLADLRAGATLIKDNTPITAAAPNVDVPLEPGDLPDARLYYHELWRVDTGNVRRLSYGDFPVIA